MSDDPISSGNCSEIDSLPSEASDPIDSLANDVADDPLLAPISDLERSLRASMGFDDLTLEELTANPDAVRESLAETGNVRLTADELAEFRARQSLAEPAASVFERARSLHNFGGFYFDAPSGQYVLRLVGSTDGAEGVVADLPPDRVRIEQGGYTIAELESVAAQIVPVGDDGLVDISKLTEPYASLVDEGRISIGIRQTEGRIVVALTTDVTCGVVAQIASILGDRGDITLMGPAVNE